MKTMKKSEKICGDIFLNGKKIYLRGLTKRDIPAWYKWFNDPEVTEYMNKGICPNTKILQEEYFRNLAKSKNDIQLGIVLKEKGSLIGIIGIHKVDWVHRNGDISIVIGDKRQWGKGVAKEAISLTVRHAFTKMNLRRLVAGMTALNLGSRRCFEDNGFVLEGTRRKHFFYKGKYVDVYMLGLLEEEWKDREIVGVKG